MKNIHFDELWLLNLNIRYTNFSPKICFSFFLPVYVLIPTHYQPNCVGPIFGVVGQNVQVDIANILISFGILIRFGVLISFGILIRFGTMLLEFLIILARNLFIYPITDVVLLQSLANLAIFWKKVLFCPMHNICIFADCSCKLLMHAVCILWLHVLMPAFCRLQAAFLKI